MEIRTHAVFMSRLLNHITYIIMLQDTYFLYSVVMVTDLLEYADEMEDSEELDKMDTSN